MAIDKKEGVHGFEQSRNAGKKMVAALPAQIFSQKNFSIIMAEKVKELSEKQ